MKSLYYWDNLDVLMTHIQDGSVDLIYLDPPFNSNRDYNANFSKSAGENDTAQMVAFEDSRRRNQQSEDMLALMRSNDFSTYRNVADMLDMFVQMLDKNDTAAYLAMMTPRLCMMHSKLKETWSLYLHCDQTANSYLRVIMDKIFGKTNYKNEIIWKRTNNPKWSQFKDKKYWIYIDVILFYAKNSDICYFELDSVRQELSKEELFKKYPKEDEKWRYLEYPILRSASKWDRPNLVYEYKNFTPPSYWWVVKKEKLIWIDERWDLWWRKNWQPYRKYRIYEDRWTPIGNLWDDILRIQSNSTESLWYPTQKPIALLERIVKASCPPDGVVLDPFCWCGTTLAAAEKLNQSKSGYTISWIGIDLTPLAINVIEKRLQEVYWLKTGKDFVVVGDPVDYAGAVKLASEKDKYHFENWVLRLLNCIPSKYKVVWGKVIPLKWWDGGYDGVARFSIKDGDNAWLMIAEVKSGKVGRRDIDIFVSAMERQKADIGVFVVLDKKSMARDGYSEAVKQGYYNFKWFDIPKVQVRSIEEYFGGVKPFLPFGIAGHIRWNKIKNTTQIQQDGLF